MQNKLSSTGTIKSFTDLDASFPENERFDLTGQIHRTAGDSMNLNVESFRPITDHSVIVS